MSQLKRRVDLGFDEAIEKVTGTLKEQGFGVLTEIAVHDVLKKKIDVDFRRYQILGACNPKLAHRALSAQLEVGTLLPCNVVVYEDDGATVISAVDPEQMLPGDSEELKSLAAEVREQLAKAVAAV
ncbi:MAG: DUF302 domain-containing protein [Sandaracinaceae bacterium]|nr:MAG: DUF302 domain-containing protein [Sandaracinaceae bacterium]HBQ17039.1 hypothetical protein [Myxococcales bacterium]